MFDRYKSYSPYDMLESIKKEVKGDLENAFLNLGKGEGSPPRWAPALSTLAGAE